MNRAKTLALLAGMVVGLATGPGCMMFDDFCDDECFCGPHYDHLEHPPARVVEPTTPGNEARPAPAIPELSR